MTDGWLSHKELKIVRGVYIAPGDPASLEAPIVALNLLSTYAGFAVTQDGWTPKIPSIKSGGIWADSPITDGRTLIAGVNSNVTETMRLIISGGTYQETAGYLAQLTNMIKDCRDFWQANAQIDPVYLHWFASCGTGRQYALIYNMDFDGEFIDSPTPTIEGTLTIERECYWRALPPGANPKQWTYEFNHQPYSVVNATIGGTTDLIPNAAPNNRSEFNAAFTALISSNFITIPAASIPGDAPALMVIGFTALDTTRSNVIIGKKTLKIPIPIYAQNTTFTATDGTMGTDATRVNDTGAVKPAGGANAQRVEVSFATVTNQLRWRSNGGTVSSILNRQIGRYQVFLRCRQNGGALGNITMYLRYGFQILTDSDGVKMNVVSPPVIGAGGASTDWGLVYMGTATLPQYPGKARVSDFNVSSSGISTATNILDFGLFALRSVAAGVLYVCDLILIPIDEGNIAIECVDASGNGSAFYDNTGFYSHGTPDEIAGNGFPINNKLTNLTGSGIQLTPNIENRLYLTTYDSSNQSRVDDAIQVSIDIIPRCTGIRGF